MLTTTVKYVFDVDNLIKISEEVFSEFEEQIPLPQFFNDVIGESDSNELMKGVIFTDCIFDCTGTYAYACNDTCANSCGQGCSAICGNLFL